MSWTPYVPTPGLHQVVEWSEQSNSRYHSDRTYLSNSCVGYYLKSPRLYGRWLSGQWTPEVTRPMRLGSAVDGLICGTFDDEMVVRPDVDRRTKAGKAEYEAFLSTLGDREEVTRDEYREASAMAAAARDHLGAHRLLSSPTMRFQKTFYCGIGDELAWKGKTDGCEPGLVLEIKTCVPPDDHSRRHEDFARLAAQRGWNRQAWLYRRMAAMHEGVADVEVQHVTICIHNKPPYDVYLYTYDEEFLTLGGVALSTAVADLVPRRNLGALDVPDCQLTVVGAPGWLKRNHT